MNFPFLAILALLLVTAELCIQKKWLRLPAVLVIVFLTAGLCFRSGVSAGDLNARYLVDTYVSDIFRTIKDSRNQQIKNKVIDKTAAEFPSALYDDKKAVHFLNDLYDISYNRNFKEALEATPPK